MPQGKINGSLHVFELVPCIIILSILYLHSIEWDSFGVEEIDRIDEPYFSSFSWFYRTQGSKYLRREDIGTMGCEVARSILWIRFFDDSIDSIDISFHECYVRDPISLQILFFFDAYPTDDYTSVFLIDMHHLRESRRSGVDKFISPEHCEWLISDHTLSREDGTPISIGSLLSNIDKICHFSNFYRFLEEFIFSSHFEIIDEILIRIIEVIFYRSFL